MTKAQADKVKAAYEDYRKKCNFQDSWTAHSEAYKKLKGIILDTCYTITKISDMAILKEITRGECDRLIAEGVCRERLEMKVDITEGGRH